MYIVMKYLKLYDSNFYSGKNPPNPDCDPQKIKINFNLIKDLCDLSLDIIDNNYRLHLWVTIQKSVISLLFCNSISGSTPVNFLRAIFQIY